jgi:CCR4-NOT transcription complex subunit 3
MSRSPSHRQTEKSVDSPDFPTIPLLPKKIPTTSSGHRLQVFRPVEVTSPDELLQTDFHQHEFVHTLFSTLNLIPDVPSDNFDYQPTNPVDVPKSFPQIPNVKLLQPEFFKNYDVSTLFYMFFYFPGTPQQFLAGRELKQRGWRFHTIDQTWFRRLTEPIEVTSQYEIGTFEYFEHKEVDGWTIRQRTEFKLEYEFLETD